MLVDDEDFEFLNQWKWCVCYLYAARREGGIIYAHRFISKAGPGQQVDHINGNKFDNRKANLRLCTQAQNNCNRGPASNNRSTVKGVNWNKKTGKWRARVSVEGKEIPLGCFSSLEDAKEARKAGAIRYHGEFARYE